MYWKKFLLTIFLLVISLIWVSFASNSWLENKVFKLKSYEYDGISKSYIVSAYGSAVLIDNNKVITNAHVILNDDEKIDGNYELCKTISFEKPPQCFSTLKLLSYDIDNDLAILEIVNSTGISSPVEKSNQKLNMWDLVKIYGYPANWWNTITFTEWKISGYIQWFYKVDANMDAGNSGWGAFDKDGKLIGISTAVSVWYTTLWLIIPMDKVNDFLNWKGNIVKYEKYPSIEFRSYIKNIELILNNKYSINDNFFTIKNLNKYWFYVSEANTTVDKKLAEYTLESKDINDDTIIFITTKWKYGEALTWNMLAEYRKISKQALLRTKRKDEKIKTKNFIYNGNDIDLLFIYDKKDKSVYLSLKTPNIRYSIYAYTKSMASIKKALYLFLKEMIFRKIGNYKNSIISFGDLKININNERAAEILDNQKKELFILLETKNLDNINVSYNKISIDKLWDNSFSEFLLEKGEFMNKYLTSMQITKLKIDKTNEWFPYGYMKMNSSDKDIWWISSYLFIVNGKNGLVLYDFSIKENDKDKILKTKVNNFIKNIKVDGKFWFKKIWTIGDIEIKYDLKKKDSSSTKTK